MVYLQDLTLKEAETIALSILKQVMEEKVSFSMAQSTFWVVRYANWLLVFPWNALLSLVLWSQVTPNNVDIAKVALAYHLYTPSEVEAVISRL